MPFGVFIHRADSIYDDQPAERYQFPAQYLGRARSFEGGWIIYYEPRKMTNTRGYFARARVAQIIPDPILPDMYLALIEPGSYQDFANPVAFSDAEGIIELGLLNENGRISGRAQSAVRPISEADFNRIVEVGLSDGIGVLSRLSSVDQQNLLHEDRSAFEYEQPRQRIEYYGTRIMRDRIFRKVVLQAYDCRCALTGLKLINGGGRAEAEAAHIRPVEADGPDRINNGLALSGTVHWMFDRGLISLEDDLRIMVSRQVNDRGSIDALLNKSGYAHLPAREMDRPHPTYLQWHRINRFKH